MPTSLTKLRRKEDDPRAFELLVKWLYQGKIDDVSDMPYDKKWDYADACQVSLLHPAEPRKHVPALPCIILEVLPS